MANEARIQSSLQIRMLSPQSKFYGPSQPGAFTANVTGTNGPTPGSLLVPTTGMVVDLSQIQIPGGLCRVQNYDPTNYIEIGPFDHVTHQFYPMVELLPTESYVWRNSRWIGFKYGSGSHPFGSGTHSAGSDSLFIRANGAPCQVLVEAHDA